MPAPPLHGRGSSRRLIRVPPGVPPASCCRRFVTKLASRNIAYKVEIVHFLTDNGG